MPKPEQKLSLNQLLEGLVQSELTPVLSENDAEVENMPVRLGELLKLEGQEFDDLHWQERDLLYEYWTYDSSRNKEMRAVLFRWYGLLAVVLPFIAQLSRTAVSPEAQATCMTVWVALLAVMSLWFSFEEHVDNWGPPRYRFSRMTGEFAGHVRRDWDQGLLEKKAQKLGLTEAYDYSTDELLKQIRKQRGLKLRKQLRKKRELLED